MKGNYTLLFVLLLVWHRAAAQQEGMYTQFMFNKMAYNPGYAGSYESEALTAIYRNQWMGLDGAPNTQILSYNQSVLRNRVGIGGNLVRHSIGISRTITLDVAYAYRIAFKRGYLGIGLQASMRHFYQNWADPRLITSQPISTDPSVPADPQSKLLPNFGFGAYYIGNKYNKEKWYFGIAAPRIVSNNIDFAETGEPFSREVQHLNAMGGINFDLNEDAQLTPQVLLKYAFGAPFDADINLSLLLNQKIYGGLTYRTGGDTNGAGESVDVLLGLQATEKLFFCLSYDIGMTRLRKFNNGSVEATIRWYFNPPQGSGVTTKPNL